MLLPRFFLSFLKCDSLSSGNSDSTPTQEISSFPGTRGFVAATAIRDFHLGDPLRNAEGILSILEEYSTKNVSFLVFPELCLTGTSCGILFGQKLLSNAVKQALSFLLQKTKNLPVTFVIGLPEETSPGVLKAVTLCIRAGEVIARNEKPLSEQFHSVTFAQIELISTSREGEEERLILCPTAVPSSLMTMDDYQSFALSVARKNNASVVVSAPIYGESVTDVWYGMPFSSGSVMVTNGGIVTPTQTESGFPISFPNDFSPVEHPSRLLFEEDPIYLEQLRTSPHPFLPANQSRANWMMASQEAALAQRMKTSGAEKLVLGVSGGLDSTLALLVSCEACKRLGLPPSSVIAVSMPGFGTTSRTKNNAGLLAEMLGCDSRTIDIREACLRHFSDIGYDPKRVDTVFENVQARERTQILMDLANMNGALVVGTGDLSELALGWCTYNGDHMSMYSVNAGVPKTLVRHLVAEYAKKTEKKIGEILLDILDTPISPELLPASENGESPQYTEKILGSYDLHDFYLFHLIRFRESPHEIQLLAENVFEGLYHPEEIRRTLKLFLRRFFTQQFKRSCSPDGISVGSVSLSPRSGWRIPSDVSPDLWVGDVKE